VLAPPAPLTVSDLGVDPAILSDLVLRAAFLLPQFTTEGMAQGLHLSHAVAGALLDHLREELLLDVLGHAGPFGYRYAISARGREAARRLHEITSYVGPAPVSLAMYTGMINQQTSEFPEVTPEGVAACLNGLVLKPDDRALAGLAASSGPESLHLRSPGQRQDNPGKATPRDPPGHALDSLLHRGRWAVCAPL
jgi:hypothetical protein